MNVHLLIDAIVRQTTVLVAQLATAGGARASLGHTANQVFLELAKELRQQGLNNKLIADMFGLSLRTYHNKIRRLSESHTDRGRPLWNAVLDFVQGQRTVSRNEVMMRFCRDDGVVVKSVLNDLVDVGLVFAKGVGEQIVYRAATPEEYELPSEKTESEARTLLVWIAVARHGTLSHSELAESLPMDPQALTNILDRLTESGKITVDDSAPDRVYHCDECVIPMGEPAGWEAGVFDHYHAMVTAICRKLQSGQQRAELGEAVGGSTYSYEVWPGHPLRDAALGFLQTTRERAARLRADIDAHNRTVRAPTEGVQRVTFYAGQSVVASDD
jgi:hypothetical protein